MVSALITLVLVGVIAVVVFSLAVTGIALVAAAILTVIPIAFGFGVAALLLLAPVLVVVLFVRLLKRPAAVSAAPASHRLRAG